MITLTRRLKIGLLVAFVLGLCVVALVSNSLSFDEGGEGTVGRRSRGGHHRHGHSSSTSSSSRKLVRKRTKSRHQIPSRRERWGEEGRPEVDDIESSVADDRQFDLQSRRKASGKGGRDGLNNNNNNNNKRKPKSRKKQKPGPITGVKMAANNNDDKFNAERVLELFSSCRNTEDEISIDCYVDGYEELCKLFKAFGSVFGFVTSDVVEKIGILREYRKSPEAESYATIQSLLEYEVEKDITNNKKKASGSRTLLRLHRALEFIEALLIKIRDVDSKEKFGTVASKAYDDTLAKHHAWLVKKAVHVAMYVLPSRTDLLKKMELEDSEKGMAALSKLTDELQIIYKITQDLYTKHNLHDLP